MLANVNALGECLNLNGEGLRLRGSCITFADGCSCGKRQGNCFFCKLDDKLAILGDGIVAIVNRPSNLNLVVILTNESKLQGGVLSDILGYGKLFKLGFNLLGRGLFNQLEVGEGSGGLGNDVETVVETNENARNVCGPAELCCMLGVDLVLVSVVGGCVAHVVRKVGNVGTNVALSSVQLEEEVLAVCYVKLLGADGNAVDYDSVSDVLAKILVVLEGVGDVNGSDCLGGGINNLNVTLRKLTHTVVIIGGTGNGNLHTNLKAEILDGILVQVVAVVAAHAVCVNESDTLILVALVDRVDHNDRTLDGHGCALFCCKELRVGSNLVLRNGAFAGVGLGGAVACLDGSGQGIFDFNGGLLVEVDVRLAVILGGDGDSLDVCRPANLVGNLSDNDGCGKGVVAGSGGRLILEIGIEVIECGLQIVYGVLLAFTFAAGNGWEASCESESREGKNRNQEKY